MNLFCDSFVGRSYSAGTSMSPANCGSFGNGEAVADGSLSTAASAATPPGCRQTVTASGGASEFGTLYLDGSNAGAFITRSANVDADMITVTATLQGIPVQTANGSSLNFEDTNGASAAEYVFLTADQPFDGVEIQIDVANPSAQATYKIFELCSNGGLK